MTQPLLAWISSVRLFAGGHFFPHESRAEVLAALAADLEPIC